MKEILQNIPEQTIPSRKIKAYEAEDGKIFYKQRDCEHHEYNVNLKKVLQNMKIVEVDDQLPESFDKWYYPKNEEELEWVKKIFGFYDTNINLRVSGDLKVNEWIMGNTIYGGDYQDTVIFYTWTYVKNEFDKMYEALNE